MRNQKVHYQRPVQALLQKRLQLPVMLQQVKAIHKMWAPINRPATPVDVDSDEETVQSQSVDESLTSTHIGIPVRQVKSKCALSATLLLA